MSLIDTIVYNASQLSKAHIRRAAKKKDLVELSIAPGLRGASHVVVFVVRNEYVRLEYFLKYYRALGFDQFLGVDNSSDDGTREFLLSQPDVSLYSTTASFGRSRYGSDWINNILNRHCRNKWILHVDADELLVFPHVESGIRKLTTYLSKRGDRSMRCIHVDMYGPKPIKDTVLPIGASPIEVCPYYDCRDYDNKVDARLGVTWTKGGIRDRIFFPNKNWHDRPALNKTPLILWKPWYAFTKVAHELAPVGLSKGCKLGNGSVSGVLLHFKLISTMPQKVVEEQVRRQHTEDYTNYGGDPLYGNTTLVNERTHRYESWRSLVDDGLMNGENWPQ